MNFGEHIQIIAECKHIHLAGDDSYELSVEEEHYRGGIIMCTDVLVSV